MYFTITTNKEVANQIVNQFEWEKKYNTGRSIELGKIIHEKEFSVVQIKGRDGQAIRPEDIFWLGRYSTDKSNIKKINP